MFHTTLATSQSPALIIYLLDVSSSMSMHLGDQRRVDVVTEALAVSLRQMVFRSTKGRSIYPRYRLAILAYNDNVYDLLDGVKGIDEVARMGVPEFSPSGTTDTAQGLARVEELLIASMPELAKCPAPVVCHMTDGIFTGNDPEPVARRIMQLGNADGNVLMANIFMTDEIGLLDDMAAQDWSGITNDTFITPESYCYKLRRMSSQLPASFRSLLKESGYSFKPGALMLLPGMRPELVALGFQMASATPIVRGA